MTRELIRGSARGAPRTTRGSVGETGEEISKWTSTGPVSCCCQCREQKVDSSFLVHEQQYAELDLLVNVRSGSPPGICLPVAEISVGFPMSGGRFTGAVVAKRSLVAI